MTSQAEIRPQPRQQEFLGSPADIAIFGGAAGGGKTWAILAEPLRHIHRPRFGCVIFRKETPQIRGEGGLWMESEKIYPLVGARGSAHTLRWTFPSGSQVSFSHMQHDSDRFNWQGQQIALIGFDELCHFSQTVFWFMLSRNRSLCGIRPYIRATCNPDPDSFVAKLISWWINQDTGYAIKERSGVVRWFCRIGEEIQWADSQEQLIETWGPKCGPMSLTFILSRLEDNQIYERADPSYRAKLQNMPQVDRERLLEGNWKIRPSAGMYFKREWFEIVDQAPVCTQTVRYWDRAGTKPKPGQDSSHGPAYSAGCKMSRSPNGFFFIQDMRRMRETPHVVRDAIINTAKQDGKAVTIAWMRDPGSAGVFESNDLSLALAGHVFSFEPETGDKLTRGMPLSSASKAGNVKIVRGPWNDALLDELENVGAPGGVYLDQFDSAGGAYNKLTEGRLIFCA